MRFPHIIIPLTLVLLAACSAPPTAAPSDTIHAPVDLPPAGTPDEAATTAVPLWSVRLGAAVNVPPAISGGLVIVATADGSIHAVDALSGRPAWDYSPDAKIWDASLRSDEELVCAGLQDGQVVCLDAETGRERWVAELGLQAQSRLELDAGRVYAPTTFVGTGLDGNYEGRAVLFALDRSDGSVAWSAETGNYILRRPLAAGDLIVTGGLYLDENGEAVNRLYALNASSGAVVWTHESGDGLVRWIEGSDGVLLFAGHSETVQALDLASGRHLWSFGPGYWMQFPAVRNGVIYFGSGDQFMQAVDAASGETLWQVEINLDALNQIGRPLLDGDRLLFNAVTGEIYAFDTAGGGQLLHLATGYSTRVGGALFQNLYIMGDPDGILSAYVLEP